MLKLALYKSLITQVKLEEMVISTVYTPVDMPIPAFLSACNVGLFIGRVIWNNRGKKSVVRMCCTGMEYGPSTCFVLTILEEQLQQAVIDAMNIVFGREHP